MTKSSLQMVWPMLVDDFAGLEQWQVWECGAQGGGEHNQGKVFSSILLFPSSPCDSEALWGAC